MPQFFRNRVYATDVGTDPEITLNHMKAQETTLETHRFLVAEQDKEINAHKKHIDELNNAHKRRIDDLNTAHGKRVDRLNNAITELTHHLDLRETRLERNKIEINKLTADNTDLNDRLRVCDETIGGVVETNRSLELQLSECRARPTVEVAQYTVVYNKLMECENVMSSLGQTLDGFARENAELRDIIQYLEGHNPQSGTIYAPDYHIQELTGANQRLALELSECREELDRCKQRLVSESSKSGNKPSKRKHDRIDPEIEQLRAEVDRQKQRHADTQQLLRKCNDATHRLRSSRSQSRDTIPVHTIIVPPRTVSLGRM